MRAVMRWLVALVAFLVLAALLGVGALRGSLATLDGEIALARLSAPVVVTRDSYGVPDIAGENRVDLARALGYLHGQELSLIHI